MNFKIKNIKQLKNNNGEIHFTYKGKDFKKPYVNGDHALYIQLNDNKGLKIITPKAKTPIKDMLKNLIKFKEINYDFFPKIYDLQISYQAIALEMEHVESADVLLDFNLKWLPEQDKDFVKNNYFAGCSLNKLTKLSYRLLKAGLNPEDEWFKKNNNLINNKIVDFHTFSCHPNIYEMETDLQQEELDNIYKEALERYHKMGINKWKGLIYEGFRFKNRNPFKGYSSDNEEYDSYRKVNFMFLNKCKLGSGKVLDIGCNEGFLSVQAALHGAKSIIGIDKCKQDIALAEDIVNKILKLKNVNFQTDDAVKFMEKNKEDYQMVILSSVLHQIYPNMKGSDAFLENISKHTKYMAFETPVNHPLMRISLEKIKLKLKKHFNHARLTYLYDAYSSGYRAIFICNK